MSLDLAHKALQLFDDDLDIDSSSKATKNSRSNGRKKKNAKAAVKAGKVGGEDIAAARAEQLLRSTLVSRLKTPKILDKVVRQQKQRSSNETRRLEVGSQRRNFTSRNAIASSATFETSKKEKAVGESSEGEEKKTAFTEEDFQKFFESYKPSKPL